MSLINLLPIANFGFLSLWFKLYGHHPNITSLKVFGCACYPYIRAYTKHKLEYKTIECIFLGYSIVSKGYLCLDLHSNHLYACMHVLFNESKFHSQSSLLNPLPIFAKLAPDIWLSNLLYLHSSNQPSILGSYVQSTPNPSTTTLHTTSPLSSTTSAFILVPHSSSPSHTSPNTSPVQSLTPLPFSTSDSPSPVPFADPNPVLFLTTNTHPMTTRSKNGITKPKLC